MNVDYTVASLPSLVFGEKAPMTMATFLSVAEACGMNGLPAKWMALDTAIRNAIAMARGDDGKFRRPCELCTIYWQNKVLEAFNEKDVMKRDELLDRVRWDAAGELTDVTSPLGKGALATYQVRLEIAIKREKISMDGGNEAFDRLTQETKR